MAKRGTPKPWSEEDLLFAYRNYNVLSNKELSDKLGRPIEIIRSALRLRLKQGKLPRTRKPYTKHEDDFLLEHYGKMKLDKLSFVLIRTKASITNRIIFLLGSSKANVASGDYTTKDISEIMGLTHATLSRLARENSDKFIMYSNTYAIEYDLFWEWIKDYLHMVNASKVNYEDLYHCPEWYKEFINAEKRKLLNAPKKGEPTSTEIALIKHLRNSGYSYRKIAKEVNRTFSAVKWILEKEQRKANNKVS